MALVVCKKCNRTFSDTRNACIHCGALLNEEKEESKYKQIKNLISLDNFDNSEQIQLEQEFLKNNKGAYKYKQSTTFDKFATFTIIFSIVFFIVYFALMIYVSVADMEGVTWYDENNVDDTLAFVSLGCAVLSVLTTILWRVIEAVIILFNKESIKKYIYLKQFQKWLLEEKNIEYEPVFKKDWQREKFDKIDLTSMKL